MTFRQILQSDDYKIFQSMINVTDKCMTKKGGRGNISFEEMLDCETAIFSNDNRYTYHTHPNGSVEPSQADRDTTNRFKKNYMFIGLVPQNEVVVYSAKDNFKDMIGRFRL